MKDSGMVQTIVDNIKHMKSIKRRDKCVKLPIPVLPMSNAMRQALKTSAQLKNTNNICTKRPH